VNRIPAFVPAMGLLFFLLWLSSGTLSPYAVTLEKPIVDRDCGYLYNLDHTFHLAQYRMLDGQPKHTWAYSPVLRRVLYPLCAYLPTKLLGFNWGGLLTNFLLNAFGIWVFMCLIRREIGESAAQVALWVIVSYPGIAYWGALPYAYGIIVPTTLVCGVLLYHLSEEDRPARIYLYALLMGVLFTGYDLYIFFLPAMGLLLLFNRRWKEIPLAFVLVMLPTMAVMFIVQAVYGVGASNENTNIYRVVLNSYFGGYDFATWKWLLKTAPWVLLHNFFFSNFVFLPLCFIVVWLWRISCKDFALLPFEWALLAAAGILWAFNNLAPPYEGWQMRGTWIARMYQPVFVVMVYFLVRHRPPKWFVAGLIVAQISVCLGGVLHLPHTTMLYHHFYEHSPRPMYHVNLDTYGRRPLGFCEPMSGGQR